MPPSATTWIQVIDDAIKIGLGALIGGFFAWLVARYNAKSTIQKLAFERRSKILSDAAQSYESFFRAFLKYSTHLCGIAEASQAKSTGSSGEAFYHSFLADRATEALKLRIHMVESMQQSFAAQSQLMLLGEDRCRERAESLYAAIMAADASYKFDGKSFTLAQYQPTSEAVRDARIDFYREMQTAFRRS